MEPVEISVSNHRSEYTKEVHSSIFVGPVETDVEKGKHGSSDTPLDLYTEVWGPLLSAAIMYIIPDIRALIRKDQLKGDPELLDRCVNEQNGNTTAQDFINVMDQNRAEIEQYIESQDDSDMYLRSLKNSIPEPEKVQVITVDDRNQEEECVYFITVSHAIQRINVSFRGSVTDRDFGQDAKAILTDILNPIGDDDPFPTVAIHLGFREYLYGKKPILAALFRKMPSAFASNDEQVHSEQQREKENDKVKIQQIMELVLRAFQENPGYSLYVQGHSLGGALATLFAFEAAAHPHIPNKPVTCITGGSPKVGNLEFLWTFERLEEERKLRYLRVTNYRDPIALLLPPGPLGLFLQKRRFRHVGIRLQLTDQIFIINYPPRVRSCCGILICDTIKSFRNLLCLGAFIVPLFILLFLVLAPLTIILAPICCVACTWYNNLFFRVEHKPEKYLERLTRHKEALSKLTLDRLYEERFAAAKWKLPYIRIDTEDTRRNWCCSYRT